MRTAGLLPGEERRFGLPSGLLAGAASPTADLYFGFACARWLAEGRIRRLSPTVFQACDTWLVFRHAAGLSRLPRNGRLVYVIDDDIRAGVLDPGLPPTYRAKLGALEWRAAWSFERRADVIVTTSAKLEERLRTLHPGKRVDRLDPAWPLDLAAQPRGSRACRRIALLMGRSHARDAAPLMPMLSQLARRSDIRLTISANVEPPRNLAENPRVEVLPVLDWTSYFEWLRHARFDIGLVPHLAARRFNATRSASKLGEYAMTGAAVLASESWGEAAAGAESGRCRLVGPRIGDWSDALEELIADTFGTRTLAERNLAKLLEMNLPSVQRRFWSRLLGIE